MKFNHQFKIICAFSHYYFPMRIQAVTQQILPDPESTSIITWMLYNFHKTSRFITYILSLKLEDLLNNSKPASPLAHSISVPLQQLIWMFFDFFPTVKIRVDKKKEKKFFSKVRTNLIIMKCFFICRLCQPTLKDTLTLQMEPVLEWNIV